VSDVTRQPGRFPGLVKPTVVAHDADATGSGDGLVPLRQLDVRVGPTAALARGITELRQEEEILQSMLDLVRQREVLP
jgi:hypothetical protein